MGYKVKFKTNGVKKNTQLEIGLNFSFIQLEFNEIVKREKMHKELEWIKKNILKENAV